MNGIVYYEISFGNNEEVRIEIKGKKSKNMRLLKNLNMIDLIV